MSEIKFEKAMTRLESIVEELERGDLNIDKSLEIFEIFYEFSKICFKCIYIYIQKFTKFQKISKNNLKCRKIS